MNAIKWFGESWGAPINEQAQRVGTPIDQNCIACTKPIYWGDQGFVVAYLGIGAERSGEVVYHKDCFFKDIGISHD